MKAVQIKNDKGDASALYIGEVDRPTLSAGEVLVKVRRRLPSLGCARRRHC
jgi:NADPH:quinone reductase-like Zn-dependent oxidoreductase